MKTNVVYKHESDSLSEALDLDQEKIKLVFSAIDQAHELGKATCNSEYLALVIDLANTPEELVVVAFTLGIANRGMQNPNPSELLRKLDMLTDLLSELPHGSDLDE